jgi:hypothetical protein
MFRPALDVSCATVEYVRRTPAATRRRKLDGEQEARLTVRQTLNKTISSPGVNSRSLMCVSS